MALLLWALSAGAHLAAMAVLSLGADEHPAALILLSGIYDLRPLLDTYVNDALGMDLVAARRNSPTLRGLSQFPRTVIGCGEIETDESKRQSRQFAQLLLDAEHEVDTIEVVGRNHFDIVHDLANASPLGTWLPRITKPQER